MASRRLVSASARETLFGIPSDTASLERNYVLADDDLDLICTRRSAENRLGLAIHIALLRHPGDRPDRTHVLYAGLDRKPPTPDGSVRQASTKAKPVTPWPGPYSRILRAAFKTVPTPLSKNASWR